MPTTHQFIDEERKNGAQTQEPISSIPDIDSKFELSQDIFSNLKATDGGSKNESFIGRQRVGSESHLSMIEEKQKKKKKQKKNKESQNKLMTIPDARKFMVEHKGVWDKLVRLIGSRFQIYQWRCYFRYAMLTILTQSNRASYQFFAYQDQKKSEK